MLFALALAIAGCSGGGDSFVSTLLQQQQAGAEFGRFVPFGSTGTNLVLDDTNNQSDIFVFDRTLLQVSRVSLSTEGEQTDKGSESPSISWDGRYVAFRSSATNLVPDDTNGRPDIFVRDRTLGVTTRVSVSSAGEQANDDSRETSISADGRYVAFRSSATNLVADDTNLQDDIFVHDRETGTTIRASLATSGAQADGESQFPVLSADARFVAFASYATNLVDGDTSKVIDVFLRDLQANTTVRVSVSTQGIEGDNQSYRPTISADGRFVAFVSDATNLVTDDTNGVSDVFRRDLQTGTTIRVSLGPNGEQSAYPSWDPWLVPDGTRVSFIALLAVEPPNGTVTASENGTTRSQAIVRDLGTGQLWMASANALGDPGNGACYETLMGLDGKHAYFCSLATDLVPDDTNLGFDVFERDLSTETTIRMSVGPEGVQSNGNSYLFVND